MAAQLNSGVNNTSMTNFKVKDTENLVANMQLIKARILMSRHEVDLLIADDGRLDNQLINTVIRLCNEETTGKFQLCAFYCSALIALFPGLRTVAVDALKDMGLKVRQLFPQHFEASGYELLPPIEAPLALVCVGQISLLLYENINARSYDHLMRDRTRAIKRCVGYDGMVGEGEDEPVIPMHKAEAIKIQLGQKTDLRTSVLNALLTNKGNTGAVGRMCAYLSKVLEWTDMALITSIFDTLLLPKSPVLRDHRVAMEVMNLYEAFRALNQSTYPQYFRIFYPEEGDALMQPLQIPYFSCGSSKC